MARRKSVQASAYKSWEDINEALRQVALAEIEISDLESAMEKQIIGVKKSAEIEIQPHLDRIKTIVKDIEIYVDEHNDELAKKKTVELNFGKVGYRLSTKVTLPKSKEKLQDIIRRLHKLGMKDCVVVKESVNKEVLKQYGEDRVLEVGAGWKQSDEFWCEAAKEKLPQCK